MTTYHVTKSGNDGNTGLPGDPWLTIDNAANNVAAGDTVWIGPGIYRELVTMDTSGADGSVISFLGDVTGANTGDAPGPVIVTAWDEETSRIPVRANALDMAQKEFITWADVIFIAGTDSQAVACSGAGNIGNEQVAFRRCVFHGGGNDSSSHTDAANLAYGTGATPATTGAMFDRCMFYGGSLRLGVTNNVAAHVNSKLTVQSCVFLTGGTSGINIVTASPASAFSIGGYAIKNCTFISCYYGVNNTYNKNTTHVSVMRNCALLATMYFAQVGLGAAGAWTIQHCIGDASVTLTISGATVIDCIIQPTFVGGVHDLWMRAHYGWSPIRSWEPFGWAGYLPIGFDQNDDAPPSADLLGDPFSGSQLPGALWYGRFDASDDAISDPNAVWTTEANIVDAIESTRGYCNTTGSDALNYVFAGGTDAPPRLDAITQVRFRVYAYTAAAASHLVTTIYTDGLAEDLGNVDVNNAAVAWSAWTALAVPAAGWDWATVQALEFKAWRSAGAGFVFLYMIQIEVTAGIGGSVGAIAARNRPARETVTPHTGSNAMHFTGPGWHDLLVPVNAVSTTITVYGRFDGSYGGANKPQMVVMNIPGVADQTDTMTVGANTWEQLSVNFTPTAQGICRVRLKSRDTSPDGLTIFDDLRRA